MRETKNRITDIQLIGTETADMQIFEKDIAIDMGTSTTLLFEQGKGIVAREPTVVAVDKFSGKIQKVGMDA